MKKVLGILAALLWMVVFLFPFVILFWMWFIAPRKVEEWLRLADWISVVICLIVGIVLAATYIVIVWPRMIGNAPSPTAGSPFVAPPPESESVMPETATPAKVETIAPTSSESPKVEAPPPTSPEAAVEQIQAVHRESLALAEAGKHLEACRRALALNGQSPGWVTNPSNHVNWCQLESSADKIRATDPAAANFVYELCIAHAEWALSFATASGEAMSEQETIRALQAKMS
jgi:hypothetical protein